MIDASGRDIRLEVDGGIKADNIRAAADAGADTFVAGSAIFGQKDYAQAIAEMRAALAVASRARSRIHPGRAPASSLRLRAGRRTAPLRGPPGDSFLSRPRA